MPEPSDARYFRHGRRRGPGAGGSGLMRADSNSIGAAAGVIGVVLSALTLHNTFVTAGMAIAAAGFALVAVAKSARSRKDPECQRRRKLDELAEKLNDDVVREPLAQGTNPEKLIGDLARLLEETERLCVIWLRGNDTLEAPPGIGEDAMPDDAKCRWIVQEICSKLGEAPALGERERAEAAADLRRVVSVSYRAKGSAGNLRDSVVRTLQQCHLAYRLVPLVDARKEALEGFAGRWLEALFKELPCTYGVFTRESGPPLPPDSIEPPAARRYVSMLGLQVPEQEFDSFLDSLFAAVSSPRGGLDPDLLKIRCAVISAATEFGAIAEARQRLVRSASPSASVPQDRTSEAALEVRWLIDRKTALIAGNSDLSGAFDRLTLFDRVTFAMFRELMRDLKLSEGATRELYDWLRGDVMQRAGVIDRTDETISLSERILSAGRAWLKQGQQSAARKAARMAAERCYRACLVLDRHVPAPGYADWVVPGYAGVHRYENPAWWRNVYAWSELVAEIDSPAHRRDAEVAVTCLFLETWWWYGDQPRSGFIDEVLSVARAVLRDQPEWMRALEDFDSNYEPELELRAAAGDRWQHVADTLSFLAGTLSLRQGDIPADTVLARIYICWCFFSGDVAEQTGRLEAADGWFSEAARACGNGEDNAAIRLFARYQQADLWIPSDIDRSRRLIMGHHLDKTADGLHDLSVRAYVARMYGDIRWQEADIGGAFDAYGRALLLTYVYQVRQELDKLPPSPYTYSLYSEMRTRFLRRLSDARESGHTSEADAAIERIRALFRPYWELKGATAAPGTDPLAGIVPPLPDEENLTFNSGYAQDARQMLTGKLKARIAEPASQLLQDSDEQASAGAAWRIDSPTLDNRRTSPDASRTAFRN